MGPCGSPLHSPELPASPPSSRPREQVRAAGCDGGGTGRKARLRGSRPWQSGALCRERRRDRVPTVARVARHRRRLCTRGLVGGRHQGGFRRRLRRQYLGRLRRRLRPSSGDQVGKRPVWSPDGSRTRSATPSTCTSWKRTATIAGWSGTRPPSARAGCRRGRRTGARWPSGSRRHRAWRRPRRQPDDDPHVWPASRSRGVVSRRGDARLRLRRPPLRRRCGRTRRASARAKVGYEDFDNAPAWSPDGRSLVFEVDSERDYGSDAIFTVRADGTRLRRLTRATRELHATRSGRPTGTRSRSTGRASAGRTPRTCSS